jgi:hypothetical protein
MTYDVLLKGLNKWHKSVIKFVGGFVGGFVVGGFVVGGFVVVKSPFR